MSWRNIRLIFRREVSDQLRDRRTLFMVVVLPLLLYPALGIGMLQMSLLFSEQARTVVILGADDLPRPRLLNNRQDRFRGRWFVNPGDALTLKVVSDHAPALRTQEETAAADAQTGSAARTAPDENGGSPEPESADSASELSPEEREASRAQLEIAQRIRTHVEEIASLRKQLAAEETETGPLERQIDQLLREIGGLFVAGNIQVLIIIPEGFAEYIARENERLVRRDDTPSPTEEVRLRPTIIRNSANEKSLIAYGRVREAFDNWEQAILSKRLQLANLPSDLTSPINADRVDLARDAELAANVWSKLFPTMLIVMAMTGAFHPAVDLGAGEKERGTMETLLISPALRSEIVIGKFLTVLLFSLVTAILNLVSMGLTGLHILTSAGGGNLQGIGDVSFPPLSQLVWVGVLAIPLASLFASLSLAFALFARSSKEGQYYLTPLLTITMGITIFCLSPAVEITPFYSVVPVMGPALLLKGMLLGGSSAAGLIWYLVPVLTSSLMYSGLSLLWAIDQFRREEVLFRESERFDLRLWLRHLLRDKEATPSFSEALFCFVLIMLLQFAMLNVFGNALASASPDQQGFRMIQLLIVQQLVIIASPALFMGILLTTSPRTTFQFRWPAWKYWGLGLALPLALHPVATELQVQLYWFFPRLPEHAKAALATLGDTNIPWYYLILAFAVAPAICEELAFRGLILSGFRQRGRDGLAIVFSAILFGVMHMIPQQVFNATLLGLVLGLLAVRSGSIWPAVLFHLVNNAFAVVHGQMTTWRPDQPWLQQITLASPYGLHYPPWLVGLAAAISCWLLWTLFAQPARSAADK